MEPKTKKLIIILIVAGVAAFLLWKNGVFSKIGKATDTGDADDADQGGSGLDPNNLEDCITVAFGNDTYADSFAKKAREVYAQNTSTLTKQAEYQKKADKRDFTLAQMATVDGAYIKCYQKQDDGTWVPRDASHKSYFNTVVDRVRNM